MSYFIHFILADNINFVQTSYEQTGNYKLPGDLFKKQFVHFKSTVTFTAGFDGDNVCEIFCILFNYHYC